MNRQPIFHERRKSEERFAASKEAPQRHIAHKDYPKYFNRLQEDGRVNSGYDSKGNILALSIPPSIPNFIQNVDPPIRPLIQALLDKNYMPISSCAGHSLLDTRYFRLCFNHPPLADQVKDSFEKIKGISVRKKRAVCNMRFRVINGEMLLTKVPVGEDLAMEYHYLNYFFNRNSLEWVYLDVDVGGRIIEDGEPIKGASKLKKIIGSLFKERTTRKLISLINSKEFPFYLW